MAESPVARFTYRAFISYSHRDKAWADWLHRSLETYRVPSRLVGTKTAHGVIPRRLNPIFRDREELASATNLGREIDEALALSECLIVICSPASAASRWVNEEVLAYKRMGHGERIFCLVVDGEPNATDLPGREAEECFCPALRFTTDTAGQPGIESVEPVGADARYCGDGKHDAKLKLIAGMLGVGFDVLKQREQHRKLQRMAAITALALVAMGLTTLLTVAALISRHDAVIAQASAERRQKQAEDLVGFMLGDLNERLEKMQRLDIIRHVNDKAMAYFSALPPTDVGDTTLAQRAKALEQIGVVRMNSGDLAGALEAFTASTRISSLLATNAPGNTQRQVAYSRTQSYIGMVHWKQNKLATAQRDFEMARDALQIPAAQADADPAALFHLTMLESNLGHVLEARGQPDIALRHFHQRLALAQRLTALQPDNGDYASQLGGAHGELGRLALQRGDLLAAITEYFADDAIETRLWLSDRADNLQRQSMLEAHAILGRTLALAGAGSEGVTHLADAVEIAGQLVKFEPDNADFRVDLALYSSQLARLKRLGGDMGVANRLTASAVGIVSGLVHQDPDNTEWQKYASEVVLEQAAQSQAAGRMETARNQARDALQRLEPMLDERPGDRDILLLAMAAKLQLAATTDSTPAARTLAEQALRSMHEAGAGAEDPRLLALQVEASLALDRMAEAQPLIARLWDTGYRDAALVGLLERTRIDYPPNPDFQERLLALTRPTPEAQSAGSAQ